MTRRFLVVACLAALPVVWAFARFAGRTPLLDGDESVFALNVADTAHGSFPLTGFYSRYGWSHPGPIAFYLFVPFHWIARGAPWGMLLGTACWSLAALGSALWLVARRATCGDARVALAAGVAAAQLLTWLTYPTASVIDPWTPSLATTLVVPLIVAAWGAAEGDAAAAGGGLVLWAIAAQLHVGFVVLGAVPLGVGFALGWARRRSLLRRPLAIGALAASLLFAPVVFDAFTGRSGNVGKVIRFFRTDAPRAGLSRGLRLIAADFSWRPTWLGGPHLQGLFGAATEASAAWLLIPFAAVIATVALRRGVDARLVRLLAITATSVIVAVLSAAQIQGFVYDYLVRWRAPIVVMFVLAVAVIVVHPLRRRYLVVHGALAGGALVAASVAAVVSIAGASAMTLRAWNWDPLVDAAVEAAPEGPLLVRAADGGYQGVMSMTVWALVHDGADVGVDPLLEPLFGDRGRLPGQADVVWMVTDSGWAYSSLSAMPGATVIALETPYEPAEETTVTTVQRSIESSLRAAGREDLLRFLDSPLVALVTADVEGVDATDAEALAALNERLEEHPRAGIVAFDPADAPDFYVPLPDNL